MVEQTTVVESEVESTDTSEVTETTDVTETAETAPEKSSNSSLLDKYTTNEDDTENKEDVSEESKEEVELIFGRYKTMEEAEKGHMELRKKLSEGGLIAPDEYSLELPEDIQIDTDDPLLGKFNEKAREMNISNAAYNEFVKLYAEDMASRMPNPEEELKKLGDNAGNIIREVTRFADNKLGDYSDVVDSIATTARGVEFLNHIRSMRSESSVPDSKQIQSKSPALTQEQVEAWQAESTRLRKAGKIEEAEVLRKKVSAGWKQLTANS